jgi:hypothetical protein
VPYVPQYLLDELETHILTTCLIHNHRETDMMATDMARVTGQFIAIVRKMDGKRPEKKGKANARKHVRHS